MANSTDTSLLELTRQFFSPQTAMAVGYSGARYQFTIHPLYGMLPQMPGIYCPCIHLRSNFWGAVYFGQSGDIKDRMYDRLAWHHHFIDFVLYGTTHVAVMRVDGGEALRQRIETDLRWGNPTPVNEQ